MSLAKRLDASGYFICGSIESQNLVAILEGTPIPDLHHVHNGNVAKALAYGFDSGPSLGLSWSFVGHYTRGDARTPPARSQPVGTSLLELANSWLPFGGEVAAPTYNAQS